VSSAIIAASPAAVDLPPYGPGGLSGGHRIASGRTHGGDPRGRTSTTTTSRLVLRLNLLVSRDPLYGVGEWAARHEPELLGLSDAQLSARNDDRIGRALDRLFDADIPTLAVKVAARAVREFDVSLDQLHNDSTTVTFHGGYESAERER